MLRGSSPCHPERGRSPAARDDGRVEGPLFPKCCHPERSATRGSGERAVEGPLFPKCCHPERSATRCSGSAQSKDPYSLSAVILSEARPAVAGSAQSKDPYSLSAVILSEARPAVAGSAQSKDPYNHPGAACPVILSPDLSGRRTLRLLLTLPVILSEAGVPHSGTTAESKDPYSLSAVILSEAGPAVAGSAQSKDPYSLSAVILSEARPAVAGSAQSKDPYNHPGAACPVILSPPALAGERRTLRFPFPFSLCPLPSSTTVAIVVPPRPCVRLFDSRTHFVRIR